MQKKLSVAEEIQLRKLHKDSIFVKTIRYLYNRIFRYLLNFEININHPRSKRQFRLNISRHKSYWVRKEKYEYKVFNFFNNFFEIVVDSEIIEIGSNIGFFSQYFYNKNISKLTCVEPDIKNFALLKKNLIGYKAELFNLAIGDGNKEIPFYLDNVTGLHSSIIEINEVFYRYYDESIKLDISKVNIKMQTLDRFIFDNNLDKVNLIKINAEMMEYKIIKNSLNNLLKICPVFVITIYSHKIERKPLLNLFNKNNYYAFNEDLRIIRNHEDLVGTIFFLNKVNHSSLLDYLNVDYD
tara:strand:+ start:9045 stop:9932 length:888 start_codon:yes stop_codon:yes gene_type:complete